MRALGLHLPRRAWWLVFAALLVLLPALADSRFALSLLSQAGIAILMCLSYWLLMGQGGMLSFGHAVYSGAGAFMAIHTLRWVEAGAAASLPVALIPLLGGMAAALLALPFGWLATRHSPTVFAMVTLGLGPRRSCFRLCLAGSLGCRPTAVPGLRWPASTGARPCKCMG